MKKVLAFVIAIFLLTAALPSALAGKIDSITVEVPKVDKVQFTLTKALDKYAEGNFGFGYGYTFYLEEGGTVTFPYDLALTKFTTNGSVSIKANVPVTIDQIAGAGMYSSDKSAYFTIDTTSSPYYSASTATADLNALKITDGSTPAPLPSAGGAAAPSTAVASGNPITVYMTVSVEGVLQIAAQPVTVSDYTVEAVLKEAHSKYYSGGDSGFHAGMSQQFVMYMIDKCWGVAATPYVIVNGTPLGADSTKPATANQATVADGDNIIVNVSKAMGTIPVVSLAVDKDGTVKATTWALDMQTFKYNSSALIEQEIVDAQTGKVLGKTDGTGKLKLKSPPDCGVVAIPGLAAAPYGTVKTFTCITTKYVPPAHDYSVFGGPDGQSLLRIVIIGLGLAVPLGAVVLHAQRKELKNHGFKYK